MTKGTIVLASLLAAAMCALSAEPLPHSIRMVTRPDGTCDYTITGVFTNGFAAVSKRRNFIDHYVDMIPNCTTANLSLVTREMYFHTSAPVLNLCSVVNKLARMGDLPYWEELVLRDRRSPAFSDSLYRLASITHATVKADTTLRWENIYLDQPTSLRVRYDKDKTGTLRFDRSTAYCMACDRFTMRLVDAKGQSIWEDIENVYADCKVAVTDEDNDAVDEIVIHRNDHNFKIHTLKWERNLQQGAAPLPSVPAGPSEGVR